MMQPKTSRSEREPGIIGHLVTYRVVAEAKARTGKIYNCKICGRPYKDRIGKIDPRGGHVICALCSMGLAEGVDYEKKHGQINFLELHDAIQNQRLPKFRSKYGFSQIELARRLGISTRHIRRIENYSYIPVSKVLEKIRNKLENVRSA